MIAFSFVDARELQGWRVRAVWVHGQQTQLGSTATIVLDENWTGSVAVGQLVRGAPGKDGRRMFEAYWVNGESE